MLESSIIIEVYIILHKYQKTYLPFICRARTLSHQFFFLEFSEENSVSIIFSHSRDKNNTGKKYIPHMKQNC